MKRFSACGLALALSILSLPSHAQSQGMGGMEMKDHQGTNGMEMKSGKNGKSQTHHGAGTVTKVDPEKGTVTIAHGPVQSMSWPAMTMTFKAKDKKLLDSIKQGDKVDFAFVQRGKDYTLTEIK